MSTLKDGAMEGQPNKDPQETECERNAELVRWKFKRRTSINKRKSSTRRKMKDNEEVESRKNRTENKVETTTNECR